MRWAIAIGAVGLLAVVVLVGALDSGRSGGDKAELTDKLKSGLEELGIPQSLTDCTVRRTRAALDNEQVENIYDSPRGAAEGTSAVLENPMVELTAKKSLIECGKQLIRAGHLKTEELLNLFPRGESS